MANTLRDEIDNAIFEWEDTENDGEHLSEEKRESLLSEICYKIYKFMEYQT